MHIPSYVTRVVFNFVEEQDELGQSVAIRSESTQLPSELVEVTIEREFARCAISILY